MKKSSRLSFNLTKTDIRALPEHNLEKKKSIIGPIQTNYIRFALKNNLFNKSANKMEGLPNRGSVS